MEKLQNWKIKNEKTKKHWMKSLKNRKIGNEDQEKMKTGKGKNWET